MGLFDFFKRIGKKKVESVKTSQEKINLYEIGNWLERKNNIIEIKEKEIFVLIQKKISILINELKEKMILVENFDIESKKAEDKINFIVNEGRKKYIESVKGLIESLENLEKNKFEKFIKDINKIFLDFNKTSHTSYERTTILIGKEMASIKESLKIFSKDLIKLFDENRDIVNSSKTLSLIKLKLDQIKEADISLEKINEKIVSLDKKIIEKEGEIEKIIEEIEKIKKSEDYIKNLEKQEKIKLFKEELEKEIQGLKQLIDFKALANFFHIFEEQMNIVKAHREDFQTSFKKDYGESILNLLNESKLNNNEISEKINQINNKKEEIIKNKQEIKKDETEELNSEITRVITEINNLKNEKAKEEKRHTNLNTNKNESIETIRENMEKMDVVLITENSNS